MLVLSGILVMVIGLMLRFNALLVVVAAGFVTGLAGGLIINDIVGAIGEAFVKNRYMSLFILILPVIGLMERHGLRERAEILIGKIKPIFSRAGKLGNTTWRNCKLSILSPLIGWAMPLPIR